MSRQRGPAEILLVEDNPGDVRLAIEAFGEGSAGGKVRVARDGEEALAVLRRQDPHSKAPRPDLIVLDLNLPKKDGRELLGEIKQDASLRRIPVVILTTSNAEQDILNTYDLHANCYIIKPVALDRFISAIKAIESFWLTLVALPPQE